MAVQCSKKKEGDHGEGKKSEQSEADDHRQLRKAEGGVCAKRISGIFGSVFCGKSKYYGVCDIFSYRADFDPALDFDGVEVTNEKQQQQLTEMFPFLQDHMFFISSDAHCLEDINEPLYQLNKEDFKDLWRKRYG